MISSALSIIEPIYSGYVSLLHRGICHNSFSINKEVAWFGMRRQFQRFKVKHTCEIDRAWKNHGMHGIRASSIKARKFKKQMFYLWARRLRQSVNIYYHINLQQYGKYLKLNVMVSTATNQKQENFLASAGDWTQDLSGIVNFECFNSVKMPVISQH